MAYNMDVELPKGGDMVEPLQGILFVKCCECGKQMESQPVAHDDEANGSTSHGYCEPCQEKYERDLRTYFRAGGGE